MPKLPEVKIALKIPHQNRIVGSPISNCYQKKVLVRKKRLIRVLIGKKYFFSVRLFFSTY